MGNFKIVVVVVAAPQALVQLIVGNRVEHFRVATSVQVETAVFADCHFLQEAVENSERVTDSTIEYLYADGEYVSFPLLIFYLQSA